MAIMPEQVPSTRGRRFPRLERVFAVRPRSKRMKNVMLASALVLFVVLSTWSFVSLAGDVTLHWWALPVLLCVTGPLAIAANASEFRIMGAINGHAIAWAAATRLTILASAANLLPLPGGVLVRTQALHVRGSSYRHALAANAAAGFVWIGSASLAIGAMVLATGGLAWVGTLLVIAGLAALAVAIQVLLSVRRSEAGRLFRSLVLVETGMVIISAARVYLSFELIGLSASVVQSTALTAAQIISAAIGIFPAGLGLREALAGVIGSMVEVGASESVAATASDRITGQMSLAIIALGLALVTRLGRSRLVTAERAADVNSRLDKPS